MPAGKRARMALIHSLWHKAAVGETSRRAQTRGISVRILCFFLGHRRSIKRVVHRGDEYRSCCRWCKKPMLRVSPGVWELSEPAAQPTATA